MIFGLRSDTNNLLFFSFFDNSLATQNTAIETFAVFAESRACRLNGIAEFFFVHGQVQVVLLERWRRNDQ